MTVNDAIIHLQQQSPDEFQVFTDYVDDLLAKRQRDLPTLISPHTEKGQGYVLALMDLSDRLNEPRKHLDHARKLQSRGKPTV
jgi:hypothetical protein